MVNLDKAGMIVSFGCAIHCILMPIVLPVLPMLGFFLGHDSNFHIYLSALIALIAVLAIVPNTIRTKRKLPLILASVGVCGIIITGLLEKHFEFIWITVATIMASSLIIYAHYLNHKRTCRCKHHG